MGQNNPKKFNFFVIFGPYVIRHDVKLLYLPVLGGFWEIKLYLYYKEKWSAVIIYYRSSIIKLPGWYKRVKFLWSLKKIANLVYIIWKLINMVAIANVIAAMFISYQIGDLFVHQKYNAAHILMYCLLF